MRRTMLLQGADAPGTTAPRTAASAARARRTTRHLLPTVAAIAAPQTLYDPAFGLEGIDFEVMRDEVLGFTELVNRMQVMPQASVAGTVTVDRIRRAQGAAGCPSDKLAGRLAVVVSLGLAAAAAPAHANAADLRLTGDTRLSPRLHELTFETTALPEPTHVRILLPKGYDSRPRGASRFSTCCTAAVDGYASWTDEGRRRGHHRRAPRASSSCPTRAGRRLRRLVQRRRGRPTRSGRPTTSSQLLPWIDAHYRTAGTGARGGGRRPVDGRLRRDELRGAPPRPVRPRPTSFSGAVDTNTRRSCEPLDRAQRRRRPAPCSVRARPRRCAGAAPTRGTSPRNLRRHRRSRCAPATASRADRRRRPGDPIECRRPRGERQSAQPARTSSASGTSLTTTAPAGTTGTTGSAASVSSFPRCKVLWGDPPAPPLTVGYRSIDPAYRVFGWRVQIDRPGARVQRAHAGPAKGVRAQRQRHGPGAHAGLATGPSASRPSRSMASPGSCA